MWRNCIDNGPMGGFWGILKRKRYYGRRFTSKHELVQMIQQYRTYLPQYAERKASKSLKKQQAECPDTLRNQQVVCSSHTTSSKSIENFGFRCFFVAKTQKMVWVKMWVNCLTHTVTHTRNKLYPRKWTRDFDPWPRSADTHLTHRVRSAAPVL